MAHISAPAERVRGFTFLGVPAVYISPAACLSPRFYLHNAEPAEGIKRVKVDCARFAVACGCASPCVRASSSPVLEHSEGARLARPYRIDCSSVSL